MIPTGEQYKLILIDVDNKDDTIDKFNELLEDHDFDNETLTEKTINNGYHYYFSLSDKQIDELKKINLKIKFGNIAGLTALIISVCRSYYYISIHKHQKTFDQYI